MTKLKTKLPPEIDRNIPAGELAALLGITTERVRQLRQAGIFTPVEGRSAYHLPTALSAYLSYKEAEQDRARAAAWERGRVAEARAREIELRTRQREAELIPMADAVGAIDTVVALLNAEAVKIPDRLEAQGLVNNAIAARVRAEIGQSLDRIAVERQKANQFLEDGKM